MELMIRERGYVVSDGIRETCLSVFREACKTEDFGNGRFVRNYLDQVVLRQAQRLMPPDKKAKNPSKKMCRELVVEDFDVNLTELLDSKEEKTHIGFCA